VAVDAFDSGEFENVAPAARIVRGGAAAGLEARIEIAVIAASMRTISSCSS